MHTAASLSLLALWLHSAAPDASAPDVLAGTMSYIVTKRCESPMEKPDEGIEWPAVRYGRSGPTWGPKKFSRCNSLGTWILSEALAAGALWATGGRAAIESSPKTAFDPAESHAAFQKMFGWDFPNRGTLAPDVIIAFDKKKLEKLANRLYVEPATPLGALTAQQIYDVAFKPYVAKLAREVAYLKKKVPAAKLAKLAKEYKAAAKSGGAAFSGPDYLAEVAKGALPDEEGAPRNGRTLGIMLRRTTDGTWPTVLKVLKKVVTDYDPELARELKL